MPAPKFKESLKTNVNETVTMVKRGQSYPNKFKPGEMQYHYFFRKTDGFEYSHYANAREEELLSAFNPGDPLEVVLAEGNRDGLRYTYIVWDAPGGSLASAAKKAPLVGVQAAMKQEESKQDYQEEQKIKGVAIPLQGYHQRIIPILLGRLEVDDWSRVTVHTAIEEALDYAEDAYNSLQERAKKLASL